MAKKSECPLRGSKCDTEICMWWSVVYSACIMVELTTAMVRISQQVAGKKK